MASVKDVPELTVVNVLCRRNLGGGGGGGGRHEICTQPNTVLASTPTEV